MGCVSIIDFACVAEAAIENLDNALAADEQSDPIRHAVLLEAINSTWADQVSARDPRFAELMPPGEGTVFERLEQLTSEPHENIVAQVALAQAVKGIQARASQISNMPLEDALGDFLERLSGLSGKRLEGLAVRLGWSGKPSITLREAGSVMRLTRQRVQQIEQRVLDRLPDHQIYMPQIDRAMTLLRQHSPLSISDAKKLLRKKGVSRADFHPASVIAVAISCGRTTGFTLDKPRECVVTDSTVESSVAITSVARKQARASGVTNVQEVTAQLVKQDIQIDEETTTRYLRSMSDFEFLEDDWFWCPPGNRDRNRLRNVTRKMLSVASPIRVGSLREGVRRVYKYREATGGLHWPIGVPPRSVLRAFYEAHPEFVLRDTDYVESAELLQYQDVLGDTERTLVNVVRSSPASVLDRASLVRQCVKRGMNEFTLNTYLTYSPIVEHVGIDIWSLRGIELNPAAVEAVRRANALRVREKRILDHGWTETGSLWIAVRLPEWVGHFVFSVPASVKRFVINRSFDAVDERGIPSGGVKVLDDGVSIGYGTFLKRRGADLDDVLVVEFSLEHDRCLLRLGDLDQPS